MPIRVQRGLESFYLLILIFLPCGDRRWCSSVIVSPWCLLPLSLLQVLPTPRERGDWNSWPAWKGVKWKFLDPQKKLLIIVFVHYLAFVFWVGFLLFKQTTTEMILFGINYATFVALKQDLNRNGKKKKVQFSRSNVCCKNPFWGIQNGIQIQNHYKARLWWVGYSILTAYSNPQSYVLRRKHRFLKAYKGHTSAMISLIISVRHRKLESLPSTRKDIWVFPHVCSSAWGNSNGHLSKQECVRKWFLWAVLPQLVFLPSAALAPWLSHQVVSRQCLNIYRRNIFLRYFATSI